MEQNNISAFKAALQRHKWPSAVRSKEHLVDFGNPSADARIHHVEKATYRLDGYPGFRYQPAALSEKVQKELSLRTIRAYCEHPHRTNIDLVPCKPSEIRNDHETFWQNWKTRCLHNRTSNGARFSKKRRTVHHQQHQSKPLYKSVKKLSWSTMGYHYDWTARAYREEQKSSLPSSLIRLSQMFALGGSISGLNTFVPSACIVNYYNSKSKMGGHRDDLELTFDKPVVSMSMGLPAVFILGGATKDDPATPILIRGGDVMMLSGGSRLSFHGVARIMKDELIPPICQDVIKQVERYQVTQLEANDDFSVSPSSSVPTFVSCQSYAGNLDDQAISDDEALKLFLEEHRININVRQVLPDGVCSIPADGN